MRNKEKTKRMEKCVRKKKKERDGRSNSHMCFYTFIRVCKMRVSLETLVVDDRWTTLVVLLLRDPHLLERSQGSQDRTTDPHGVFPLWRSDDLDLHRRWSQSGDLLLHSLSDTWEHGGTTGHDDVTVQFLTDIDITLDDRVVSSLVDTGGLKTENRWLEEGLWSSESLVTDSDDLTVWQLVGLLDRGGLSSGLHLLLEVESDVT